MIVGKEYKDKFLPHWEKWKRVTFRGYNYGGIIANQLGSLHHSDISSFSNKFNTKKSIKLLFKSLIHTKVNNVNISVVGNPEGKQISFLSEEDGRSDYQQQCEFVLTELGEYNVKVFNILQNSSIKKQFNFSDFINKVLLLIKLLVNVPIVSRFRINGLAKNLFLISKCLYYYAFIKHIEKNRILEQPELLIVFSDMKEYGNIFVQVAKYKKISTATLQHGIYIKQDEQNFSQSSINYLNSPSDYVLGWGHSIEGIFKDTGKKGVLLSGTSVVEYQTKNFYNSTSERSKKNLFFVLLFSRNTLRESNLKMLSIAESVAKATGLKYNVLMHPSNKTEDYSFDTREGLNEALKGSSNLISLIEHSDFCICHSTTVYFTVLLKKKRCFRLKDNLFIDYGGLDDIITDSNGLLKRLESDEQTPAVERDKEVERLLIHHFGEPIFSYRESVRHILSNKDINTADI